MLTIIVNRLGLFTMQGESNVFTSEHAEALLSSFFSRNTTETSFGESFDTSGAMDSLYSLAQEYGLDLSSLTEHLSAADLEKYFEMIPSNLRSPFTALNTYALSKSAKLNWKSNKHDAAFDLAGLAASLGGLNLPSYFSFPVLAELGKVISNTLRGDTILARRHLSNFIDKFVTIGAFTELFLVGFPMLVTFGGPAAAAWLSSSAVQFAVIMPLSIYGMPYIAKAWQALKSIPLVKWRQSTVDALDTEVTKESPDAEKIMSALLVDTDLSFLLKALSNPAINAIIKEKLPEAFKRLSARSDNYKNPLALINLSQSVTEFTDWVVSLRKGVKGIDMGLIADLQKWVPAEKLQAFTSKFLPYIIQVAALPTDIMVTFLSGSPKREKMFTDAVNLAFELKDSAGFKQFINTAYKLDPTAKEYNKSYQKVEADLFKKLNAVNAEVVKRINTRRAKKAEAATSVEPVSPKPLLLSGGPASTPIGSSSFIQPSCSMGGSWNWMNPLSAILPSFGGRRKHVIC